VAAHRPYYWAEFLRLKYMEFGEAARCIGATRPDIVINSWVYEEIKCPGSAISNSGSQLALSSAKHGS
jgi:hypothetical protein